MTEIPRLCCLLNTLPDVTLNNFSILRAVVLFVWRQL